MASCRECGAAVEWVRLLPGKGAAGTGASQHPIDVGVNEVPGVGAVALNRATGNAVVVRADDPVAAWVDRGVEFRRSHFASCPGAQTVRDRRAGQEHLF